MGVLLSILLLGGLACRHLPIVLFHGMGDTYDSPGIKRVSAEIKSALGPEVFVYPIRIGENSSDDKWNSFFDDVNRQIAEVWEQLSAIDELKGGFNAIGFSQGGQFLRAYVERYNDPPVRTLITLGAQHQGVMALPGCPSNDSECGMWNKMMKLGVYNPLIRNRVLQAQYYKNQADIEKYLQYNTFLTDINNEFGINELYRNNLSSLERFVMYVFENDTMVVPKESGWFGYFDGTKVLSAYEQDLYLQDRIGLHKLDSEDRLFFGLVKGSDHVPPTIP